MGFGEKDAGSVSESRVLSQSICWSGPTGSGRLVLSTEGTMPVPDTTEAGDAGLRVPIVRVGTSLGGGGDRSLLPLGS